MAARIAVDLRSHTARHVARKFHGVVVSAGLMDKTVKVRVGGQRWHPFLQKYFDAPRHYLVHDPNSSLQTGDVVIIGSGWRTSKHKRHVLKEIVKPSGTPISERPPVLTEQQLVEQWLDKRQAKEARRASSRATQTHIYNIDKETTTLEQDVLQVVGPFANNTNLPPGISDDT